MLVMGCGGRDATLSAAVLKMLVMGCGGRDATLSAALLNIYKLVMDGGALYGR